MKLTKIESYEIQAFAFRVMTGYMAPGKDVSPLACEAPYEERCAAWDEWRNKHAHCILAMLHGFEALIDRDDEPTGALLDEMEQMRELADALAHGTHFVDSPELHETMTRAAEYLRAQADAKPVGYVTANGLRSLRQDDATVLLYAHDYLIRPDHVALYTHPAPAAPPRAMLDSHRRLVEQAIQDTEHPSGMSTHDGKARIDASILRRMLAIIDSLPAAPQAEPKLGELMREQRNSRIVAGAYPDGNPNAGAIMAQTSQAEPKREPSAAEWLSTDDAETHLAAAMRDAARIAPPSDDKAILDALKRRGIWLAQIGGIERLTAENLHLRQSATVSVSSTLHDAALAELNGEIDRLTAERDEARAERDAMAKDAERYRFLSCKGVPPYFHRCSRWRLEYWNGEWWDPLMKEELDAAIDAQIEKEERP